MFARLSSLVLALALAGCVTSGSVEPDSKGFIDPDAADSVAEIRVPAPPADAFSDILFLDPPNCVVVMPYKASIRPELVAVEIEDAAARQFSLKVDRVIGGTERRDVTRELALDLAHAGDRRQFAALTGCRHFLTIERFGKGSSYGLVWTERRLGLMLSLHALDDDPDRPLWKVYRMAARADGGMPLSPISAISAVARAGKLARDPEVPHSILDDVLRRAAEAFPSFRHLGGTHG